MGICRTKKKAFRSARTLIPAYLKSRFRPRPVWAHLYVTRKCNLNCRYCFVKDNRRENLASEELTRVIDKLHSLGCRLLSFLGGEPTLRGDLPDLVRHASSKPMITHLSTNGTILTPDYIDRLGQAGIDVINLSVDSVLHCDHSGKDYAGCKDVLVNLLVGRKRYGFDLTVNLVLTSKNLRTAVRTVELINALGIAVSVGLIIPSTIAGAPQDESLFFTSGSQKEELARVLDQIRSMKRSGHQIIEPSQYFRDAARFANGHQVDWYCAAGKYYLSVDCDARAMICGSLPAEEFSIFDLDKSYYRKIKQYSRERLNKCKKDCLSNCLYDTSYFIKHPIYFLFRKLL
jgi:MoaA/NifB/PqqE/SkfB family radical SAM enzyme